MSNDTNTTAPAPTGVASSVISKAFGEYLLRTQRGEQFAVTRNDKPLAALVDYGWWQRKAAPDTGNTAMMRNTDGEPLDRTWYANHLRAIDGAEHNDVRHEVRAGTLLVAAELLDELAAVYAGEDLGQLAREVAVRLYDAAGV